MRNDTLLHLAFKQAGSNSSIIDELDVSASPLYRSQVLEPESTAVARNEIDRIFQSALISNKTDEILPQKVIRYIPKGIRRVPKSRFTVLQKWEGIIQEISGSNCTAVIRDLIDDDQPEEEITFGVEDISVSDRPLLAEGAVFYWYIGYLDRANGQRTRESRFVFRRLPVWKQKDINKISAASKSLRDLMADSSANSDANPQLEDITSSSEVLDFSGQLDFCEETPSPANLLLLPEPKDFIIGLDELADEVEKIDASPFDDLHDFWEEIDEKSKVNSQGGGKKNRKTKSFAHS